MGVTRADGDASCCREREGKGSATSPIEKGQGELKHHVPAPPPRPQESSVGSSAPHDLLHIVCDIRSNCRADDACAYHNAPRVNGKVVTSNNKSELAIRRLPQHQTVDKRILVRMSRRRKFFLLRAVAARRFKFIAATS